MIGSYTLNFSNSKAEAQLLMTSQIRPLEFD